MPLTVALKQREGPITVHLLHGGLFNFGDALGPFILGQMTDSSKCILKAQDLGYPHNTRREIRKIREQMLIGLGSVAGWDTVKKFPVSIYGSGMLKTTQDDYMYHGEVFAVRGPKTRDFLRSKGFEVPNVLGDPGLLLPLFYKPKKVAINPK
eukprot:CAMPEP_0167765546 /NCGR_PEP_ID=MMETSP0110_2-20121227/14765_1 /TAXON_ID=629695 /ORGANISM="Gymnochlora sp., Strain CCMP2014" /LENGTH=151 /DNA_ID=CAMNT_0007653307 /DNA_START=244 /DNA_END=696 /DNA_ORIENTATION=-